ncbi:MAG: rSAM/selenodomain-associated transferase 1 [Roseivirga sp.]|jgi:rSAM/selenodomain-associated transferase 1
MENRLNSIMSKELLIIFVKNPELGRVKTRLAATVGDQNALSIYKRLLERTKEVTVPLSVDKVVYYDLTMGSDDLWSNDGFNKDLQHQGDLGHRMSIAFEKSFQIGYNKVCIIGSDCFELTTEVLNTAFNALDKTNAVIGGAKDGGYYLVGTSQFIPQIFENKQWSTAEVYTDTIKDFKELGHSFIELPKLNDIDREEDLGPWADELLKKN